MDETPRKPKVDLNSELGVSRRDLLKRGAIVAGTLAWTAPAIQSMAPKALAQVQGPSPGVCAACYCWSEDANGNLTKEFGTHNGPEDHQFTADTCENYCKRQSGFQTSGAPGGPYQHSAYCSGGRPCDTQSGVVGTSTIGGVSCA